MVQAVYRVYALIFLSACRLSFRIGKPPRKYRRLVPARGFNARAVGYIFIYELTLEWEAIGQGGESVRAFVLIKVEPGKVREVFGAVKGMRAVVDAFCITGPDDIIAVLESDDAKGVSEVVIAELHNVEGIKGTDTRIVVELP
jgi:DNA-binding Lrp family transcriptional regulator